jgi:predicted metal-dependent peptidase
MPKLSNVKPVPLTPQQQKLWDDTRVALLWKCPAFTHILYSMLDNAGSKHVALFTDAVPIAATDGRAVLINPERFFKFNLYERVFILAHEIMHCILNHCVLGWQMSKRGHVAYPDGKKLDYDSQQMNVAMDLVINDALVQSGIGTMPSEGLHDPKLITQADSFTDADRRIYKKNPDGNSGGGDGGFDQHLAPGSSDGQDSQSAAAQRNETEWQTAVAQAAQAAKLQGKLPASLERLLSEVLEPKVDWREHIQALFARKLGSGSYDWRRPDRRLIVQDIYAPGRSGFGAEFVVVGIDTSGSIGQRELDMFMGEVSGILEDIRPKRLAVIMCDASINAVHELDSPADLRDVKLVGGGGTDFRPVFKWIEEQGGTPDALVYLTDGIGSFPSHCPNYPVIWGNIYKDSKYPFGDVVDVPKQAA